MGLLSLKIGGVIILIYNPLWEELVPEFLKLQDKNKKEKSGHDLIVMCLLDLHRRLDGIEDAIKKINDL